MTLPRFTRQQIKEWATDGSFTRGVDYFRGGLVKRVWVEQGRKFEAEVAGVKPERVEILQTRKKGVQVNCSCLYDWGGLCKHAVAVMLYILNGPLPRVSLRGADFSGGDEGLKHTLDRLTGDQLREFVHQTIVENPAQRRDLEIFARGSEESPLSMLDYKDELDRDLKCHFQEAALTDPDRGGAADETLNAIAENYFEQAQKYRNQENYREALKIYQALFEVFGALLAEVEGEELLEDEAYFYCGRAIEHLCDCLAESDFDWEARREHLEYLTDLLFKQPYGLHAYEAVALAAVTSQRDARYFLDAFDAANLSSGKKIEIARAWLQLLEFTGDSKRFVEMAERLFPERPELAPDLIQKHLDEGRPAEARRVGETALRKLPPEEQKDVRVLMVQTYDPKENYSRAVENLRSLLFIDYDVDRYRALKEVLKTPEERKLLEEEAIERLPIEIAARAFIEERNWPSLLALARRKRRDPEMPNVLEALREPYPDETFKLYRTAIRNVLERAKTFRQARCAAEWLKEMRRTPNHDQAFHSFLKSLRKAHAGNPFIAEALSRL